MYYIRANQSFQIPFKVNLRRQFSDSFDVYLDILNQVSRAVNVALKQDSPNWRMLNVCPPCMYALEGEIPLDPAQIVQLDANDSLKRCERATATTDLHGHAMRQTSELHDSRQYENDYYLSVADVDVFKDEVKRRASGAVSQSLDMFPSTDPLHEA